MDILQSELYPILMCTIHQAEDLCEAASHAAYYLRCGPFHDFVLAGVESATEQAGMHIRNAGAWLEQTYQESNWFDLPSESPPGQPSKKLFKLLVMDVRRCLKKIRRAIRLLGDDPSRKPERRELRKAYACMLGCYCSVRQVERVYLAWQLAK